MLLFSTVKIVATAAVLVLAVLGGLVFVASRRGWERNGYFTIPAVVLIVITLFLFFQGLGSGVTAAIIGTNIELHPLAALTINGLAEISVLMFGAIIISNAARQNLFAVFRLEGFRQTPGMAYILAIPMMFVAQMGGVAICTLWERFWKFFPDFYRVVDKYESASDQSMQGLVTANGPLDLLLIIIFVAIVPALAEETLFRGFTQTNIERSGHHHTRTMLALFVASFLFALVHGYLFKFPGLFALGLTLGWLTYRTNNLFVGALAHAVNNGTIVATLYLSPDVASTTSTNLVGTGDMSGSTALVGTGVAVLLMVPLLYLFNRVTAPIAARGNAERELQERLAPHSAEPIESTSSDYSDHE